MDDIKLKEMQTVILDYCRANDIEAVELHLMLMLLAHSLGAALDKASEEQAN